MRTSSFRWTVGCAGISALLFASAGCGGAPEGPPGIELAPLPAADEPVQASAEPPPDVAFDTAPDAAIGGGPALGCSAKRADGWVRMRCEGLAFMGALPWRVDVHLPNDDIAVRTDESLGRVQMVWPEATRVVASIVWHPYFYRFEGGGGTGSVGRFDGAPSGTAEDWIDWACQCPPRLAPKLLLEGFACESPTVDPDSFEPWDPGCLAHRSEPDGCQAMNECLTREPTQTVRCANDEIASGPPPLRSCHKACDAQAPCPRGFACEPAQIVKGDALVEGPTACFVTDDALTDYVSALGERLGP